MQKKVDELNLVARLSEIVFGDGFLHYGFWPQGLPNVSSLCALGKAQADFVDLLVTAFPEDTKKILDVGSGTGAIALNLSRRGYDMTCICPSEPMNQLARAKLPFGTNVYTTKFEDFETTDTFDLCIFAESFHYINLQQALAKSAHLAQRGVVIFDYFRRESKRAKASEQGTRSTHVEFLAELMVQRNFRIMQNDNMTDFITPTFTLLDDLQENQVAPLISDIRAQIKARSPLKAWLVERLIGRYLDQLSRAKKRAAYFADFYEYRLIVLEKI